MDDKPFVLLPGAAKTDASAPIRPIFLDPPAEFMPFFRVHLPAAAVLHDRIYLFGGKGGMSHRLFHKKRGPIALLREALVNSPYARGRPSAGTAHQL